MRTRIPYRTILAAVAAGDLVGLRPSGSSHGQIMISEASWKSWLDSVRVRPRPSQLPLDSRRIGDLALR